MENILDLISLNKYTVSPKKFLSLSQDEKRNIESCEFVPPKIGSKKFGHFSITLKYPVYTYYGQTK